MSNYYILTNLLSDDERRVITSIVRHIELGGNKVGIQQIASENYVSTAFIMKLCKRLGFAGYSELYYNLAQSRATAPAIRTRCAALSTAIRRSRPSSSAKC